MKVGLIDVDGHHFPNLCLMKLSAYHKQRGDEVEWYSPQQPCYDLVYMSKVFSDEYSPCPPEPINAKRVVKGGTGYAIHLEKGKEVYHKEQDPPPLRRRSKAATPITACTRNIQASGSR